MPEPLKKILFSLGIGLCALFFFILTTTGEKEDKENVEIYAAIDQSESNSDDESIPQANVAIVDIKGEVNQPGVYEVDLDSRVNDVVEIAGGFTDLADQNQINLAQKVQDEMIIIVYKKNLEGMEEGNSDSSSLNSNGQKIRINYATQEEIETLNGIGPAKAQAIIQYREENGLFRSPEDLLEVSGIGEKTLQNFIDQIQIP